VGVSSHADVAFAACLGSSPSSCSASPVAGRDSESGIGIGLLALSAFCAFYAVASVQMFAFLRSPLTYPLLYLAGDLKSMRSSIGSFLSPAFVAALVLVPLLHVIAVRLSSRERTQAPGRVKRAVRVACLARSPCGSPGEPAPPTVAGRTVPTS